MPAHRKLIPFHTPVQGRELAPKRAAFVRMYVELGNGEEAVTRAGYATKDPARYARVLKHRLRDYIEEEVTQRLAVEQPVALHTILDLAANAKSESVKLGAARDILDRGNNLRGERRIAEPNAGQSDVALWKEIERKLGPERAKQMFPELVPQEEPIQIN